MGGLFSALFGWLPLGLQGICLGVVFIFFIFTVLHIIRFILEIIPFL